MVAKPRFPKREVDPDTHPRAELVDTTDWFLKLKRTEKDLDRTKKQYILAQRQIDEMNAVLGWCLKIIEMVYRERIDAANDWLEKALVRFPWLRSHLSEKRIVTDRLLSDHGLEPPETP
ncbi:MAG: hypothetical protein GTO14_03300 [Anaerolineales bacterium]|nr:hypothetical protein [Anaerolineales bacterium]